MINYNAAGPYPSCFRNLSEDEKIKAGLEEPKGHDIEEGDYKAFFQKAMKKFGISSPDELDDDKKKKFFNYVDANYKGEKETD